MVVASLALILCLIAGTMGYQHGDVVTANFRTLHDSWRTELEDLPLHNMPRFRISDKFIIHARVPIESSSSSSVVGGDSKETKPKVARVNPLKDVKTSFTFAHSVQVPWTVVYDAKQRRSLSKLVITFSHDKYDIVRVASEKEYGEPKEKGKIDPNHPSTLGFEVEYRWEGIDDTDSSMGVMFMFIACFVSIVGLIVIVSCGLGDDQLDMYMSGKGKTHVNRSHSSGSSSGYRHAGGRGVASAAEFNSNNSDSDWAQPDEGEVQYPYVNDYSQGQGQNGFDEATTVGDGMRRR